MTVATASPAGAGPSDDDSDAAYRSALTRATRIVVKIGSKALASDPRVYERLGAAVARAQGEGRGITIVSSGAIALGVQKLKLGARPTEMAWLQAAAAAGQSVLMRMYEEAFSRHGLAVAQVLLTHADLADRTRVNNARHALGALLEAGAVPIINENDTVATDEIRFGDNDQLASMVTPLVGAELLILLSDVPGLLNLHGERVPVVRNVAREARPLARGATSGVGTGGMASKVEAARRATLAGASVVVADARGQDPVGGILAGLDVGTLFVPHPQRIQARAHWIAFTLRPRGSVLLDPRGIAELLAGGADLLPERVLGVRGDFSPGDAITIVTGDGREIARGLTRVGSAEASAVAGKRRDELATTRGTDDEVVIVHRDDLVRCDDD